ncbi:hypothetical protein BGW39_008967, partial [Mortierella sp. 14UC]
DIKEWNAERGKHPPLRGDYLIGGAWVDTPPSFAATMDGSPDLPMRCMISTPSECHVFDHETFRRGKLHRMFPYKLTYKPYRSGVDNVVIKSLYGGDPMTIHAIATVPVVVEGMLCLVPDVFLVDLAPQIQGIFSGKFMRDFRMNLSFGEGELQILTYVPKRNTTKNTAKGKKRM